MHIQFIHYIYKYVKFLFNHMLIIKFENKFIYHINIIVYKAKF